MNEGSFLFCRVLFLFGAFVRPFCLCSIGLVSDLPMKKQKEQLIVNKLRYSRVTYRYMYFIFQSASSTRCALTGAGPEFSPQVPAKVKVEKSEVGKTEVSKASSENNDSDATGVRKSDPM